MEENPERERPRTPGPSFEPVRGCPDCTSHVSRAASAWRIGGPIYWLIYDILGEEHVEIVHEGRPPHEVRQIVLPRPPAIPE